ncbi:MAG: Crp/Fnr family transcriptional regulator [Turicibacter sp.]
MATHKEEKLEKLFEHYPILETIIIAKNINNGQDIIFKHLNTHDFLQSTHDSCIQFPFIIKGELKIQKFDNDGKSIHLYTLKPGDICHEGLRCLMNMDPTQLTATAVVDSLVCLIPIPIVKKTLLTHPLFLTYIYTDISNKFTHLVHNKHELVNESLEKRLVRLLLQNDSLIIYRTHQELAIELDSAREVVSKKLKDLETRGYLTLSRGKIKLIDTIRELI